MAARNSSPDAVFKLILCAGSAAGSAGEPFPSVVLDRVEAGAALEQAASVSVQSKTSRM
jgi:hypothetical protein